MVANDFLIRAAKVAAGAGGAGYDDAVDLYHRIAPSRDRRSRKPESGDDRRSLRSGAVR